MGFSNWKNKKKSAPQQSTNALVVKQFLADCPHLPLVYRAQVSNLNAASWYGDNALQLKADLAEFGAILLRGFKMTSEDDFKQFCDTAIEKKAAYVEGATPRTQLQSGIYTSTEFPKEQEIALHNELSYVVTPPSMLVFGCLIAAQSGGQTQIADVGKVHERLSKELVEEFDQRGGWMLQRNYGGGIGPTINKAFGMDDIEQIKDYCQRADVEMEVLEKDRVVTRQRRKAVHPHPRSARPLWFNHIAFWHPSSLSDSVQAQLKSVMTQDQYPYSTYFADGSEIPDAMLEQMRRAYADEEVKFDWQPGDIMLLDNYQVAHGRKPFEGERKVLVAMG